jgi:hypothetical protein
MGFPTLMKYDSVEVMEQGRFMEKLSLHLKSLAWEFRTCPLVY